MSTELKSDPVNFHSNKEKSPEPPTLVKKMTPLKMPISPLVTSPPIKSPTPLAIKSPLGSSIKSPLSSLARAEQIFSQSSSSESSDTESTHQNPSAKNLTIVTIPRKISSNSVGSLSEIGEERSISKRVSGNSPKRVSVVDPVNELKEEIAVLDFDDAGRPKTISPEPIRVSDLHQHRAEIMETLNATKNLAIPKSDAGSVQSKSHKSMTPVGSLSPRRKTTTRSVETSARLSQLASETAHSSRRTSGLNTRNSQVSSKSSERNSNEDKKRSTVGSSVASPRNTLELSRKSQEMTSSQVSQHSDNPKSKTDGRSSINSGIRLLEMKSPRSSKASNRQGSARSSVEEALSSKRGFIPSEDENSHRSNDKSVRKSFEKPIEVNNSARSSEKRQSKRQTIAEILDSDDDEKPWYDNPKTNERKSKLFASSFNALEDDEDSFSYE